MENGDLVRRLRTCSQEKRREVAEELVRTEDLALFCTLIEELKRMAEGRRRHWLRWYNKRDKEIALEVLKLCGARSDYVKGCLISYRASKQLNDTPSSCDKPFGPGNIVMFGSEAVDADKLNP
jgi:hypothetical protein